MTWKILLWHFYIKWEVTFKLTRDRNGFHAIDINDEDGEPIVVADEDIQEDAHPHERQIYPEVFEGTVQSFSWAKGSGNLKNEKKQV